MGPNIPATMGKPLCLFRYFSPQQYDEKNIISLGKLGVFPWHGLMSQCTGLLRSEDG